MKELSGKLLLAPMAGITDRAFRDVCSSFGAALTYTEMVSATGLYYDSKKTAELLATDIPVAVQLFGNKPSVIAREGAHICELLSDKLVLIDINMGCPVRKIIKNGEGCALMGHPLLAAAIVCALKHAVNVPVSVKFRAGLTEDNINAPEFARALEAAGADMLTVHGRTADALYTGRSDPSVIAAVKRAVKLPVIASGDIFCAADARKVMETTGCDAVMAARGALGNPFIFREFLGGAAPTAQEKIETAIRQLRLSVKYKGEYRAVMEFRHHACAYTKGIPGAAYLRRSLVMAQNAAEFERLLYSLGDKDS